MRLPGNASDFVDSNGTEEVTSIERDVSTSSTTTSLLSTLYSIVTGTTGYGSEQNVTLFNNDATSESWNELTSDSSPSSERPSTIDPTTLINSVTSELSSSRSSSSASDLSTSSLSTEHPSPWINLTETMIVPHNRTEVPDFVTDYVTTAETPEEGLSSIHIHFIIVGVLFGLVLIMLALHNYIEIMTDGGKKSMPAFGGGGGDKSKPRATLRPVISKSKSGGSGKGGSKL